MSGPSPASRRAIDYAEVLRRPGLVDSLQRQCRIAVAGPTTLLALMTSFQMGFRTLAIEKRSSEVWRTLGAVKTEFGKFGDVLDAVQKKLQEASNKIEQTGVRARAIQRGGSLSTWRSGDSGASPTSPNTSRTVRGPNNGNST